MPRMSKREKEMWAFYISPDTGRRKYNDLCRSCIGECKQSYRAVIVSCPVYRSKRMQNAADQ